MKTNISTTDRTLGIFFLSSSVILFELSLIRIYSVILFYHFAFMAVSVAMLGLAIAGLVVYKFPHHFTSDQLPKWASFWTFLFALSLPIVLNIVFRIKVNPYLSPPDIASQLTAIYLLSSIPFIFAGIVLCGLFVTAGREVGRIYGGDLAGAGLGALLIIPLIRVVGGESVVWYVSALALIANFFFSEMPRRLLFLTLSVLMIGFGLTNPVFGWVKIVYSKTYRLEQLEIYYNRWNAFSRVMAIPFRPGTDAAYTWAPSPRYPLPKVEHLSLMFDDGAASPVIPFDGENLEPVRYLWYDLTALGHRLRGDGITCIIGCGGGRDVLTALIAGAQRVDAVDINALVFDAMNTSLARFSGHLYRHPKVNPVVAEGRSWARRNPKTYDLIQVAMIDTWAATIAGAYALTENSLYTVEAFKDFLRALRPGGLLTFTRFFFNPPRQALRLAAIFIQAAEELGITDPASNILVARYESLATLIFKAEPFTRQEIQKFNEDLTELGFELVYTPIQRINPYFKALLETPNRAEFFQKYPFDVTPTTDERPFFFNILKMKDFLRVFEIREGQKFNYYATYLLLVVLILSLGITGLMIIIPGALIGDSVQSKPPFWLLLYFVLIGLGYIATETAIIQRFVLLLENPLAASGAVLAGLLVSSGVGSYLYWRKGSPISKNEAVKVWFFLGIFLAIHAFWGSIIVRQTLNFPMVVKLLLTVILITPLGLFMGIPMPMGLRLADRWGGGVVAWCWAINGAASVVASPLAVAIAIAYGFGAVLKWSLVFYIIAGLFLVTIHWRKMGGNKFS